MISKGLVQIRRFVGLILVLLHVNHRVQRIPVDQNDDAILSYKHEAFASALKLEADLYHRVRELEPDVSLNATNTDHSLPNTTLHQPIVFPSNSKSTPVYKLGIQFDGNPKGLLSFIEKVEEVSFARNVSKLDLFHSASDLFTDKAIFWYRQIKSSVANWESLISKLKKDFLTSDYDEEIWNQIKARKQGRLEPVVIFIACMEALFARLSHSPAEPTKIKYIKHGLQAEYQKRLALSDINGIEVLSKLCKRLEEADILSLASTSSHTKCYIDSELAYISDSSFSHQNQQNLHKHKTQCNKNPNFYKKSFHKNKIHSLESYNPGTVKNNIVCWSCDLPNHTFRNCLAPSKKKFCYKCGSANVTVKECSKCSGNAQ